MINSKAAYLRKVRPQQLREPTLPYLPTRAMEWMLANARVYEARPAYNVTYLVMQNPKSDAMGFAYWAAMVVGYMDRTPLGSTFMNRYEAQTVCEAWEYERVRAKALTASSEGRDASRSIAVASEPSSRELAKRENEEDEK